LHNLFLLLFVYKGEIAIVGKKERRKGKKGDGEGKERREEKRGGGDG